MVTKNRLRSAKGGELLRKNGQGKGSVGHQAESGTQEVICPERHQKPPFSSGEFLTSLEQGPIPAVSQPAGGDSGAWKLQWGQARGQKCGFLI